MFTTQTRGTRYLAVDIERLEGCDGEAKTNPPQSVGFAPVDANGKRVR